MSRSSSASGSELLSVSSRSKTCVAGLKPWLGLGLKLQDLVFNLKLMVRLLGFIVSLKNPLGEKPSYANLIKLLWSVSAVDDRATI